MEVLMPSVMNTESAIGYAKKLYDGDYRHWCAPIGWCRDAASWLLRAFGEESHAYHYEVACQRHAGQRRACQEQLTEHVVVVYRGLAFDLTRGQFGKGLKRIIGEDVSILEMLYGPPVNINQDIYPDWGETGRTQLAP